MCVITVVVLVILAFLLTVVVTPANTGYTRFKPAVPITNVAIESDKMTNIPIFLCTLYSAFDTKQSISKVRRRYC